MYDYRLQVPYEFIASRLSPEVHKDLEGTMQSGYHKEQARRFTGTLGLRPVLASGRVTVHITYIISPKMPRCQRTFSNYECTSGLRQAAL
jgi:hypothetical protein